MRRNAAVSKLRVRDDGEAALLLKTYCDFRCSLYAIGILVCPAHRNMQSTFRRVEYWV